MADVDPETLLEWLQMGQGEERDMQLIALEQLCMLLLMSDNVDRCFESCPPRTFLPALCRIFLDEHAPDNVLEVTARAITYYLDVSAECTRRIVAVDGAIKALCNRLVVVELSSRTSKDLAEQCIKVLELMCTRESGSIFEAGGLHCVLSFIRDNGSQVHKDTLHSAMAVVSRLCGKMEPSDASLETCVESLSTLLKHEDSHVADGSLRCFASLADRFTRRGVDPLPLAKHGLSAELLERLSNCGMTAAVATGTKAAAGAAGTTPDAKGNPNISTVISLLSTLCRGSPSVTHDLLRSNLPEAIEKALQGDERCVLDTMRLVDLLLVLLFEGRTALPKTNIGTVTRTMSGLRRLDSAGERSHRHLIDCIRSKDTDALIDAIDTGVEVNYMDDVGQTLLNWASAFGTQEMVEFLCERGADVNRGQRSSSLHYAACFGRPQVAKTLLRHGANPDLRDEDGKTPLDKARERNDEGHREVMQILQSPGEWMVPVTPTSDAAVSSPEEATKPEGDMEFTEPKGDPEMAPVYLRRLLPIFAQVYNNTMMPSIRKASLALIRKMIHYTPCALLNEVCIGEAVCFTQVLVEVLAAVLDHEDDDDGHLTALQIIQDIMRKGQDLFLDHFARLGIFSKVSMLAGPPEVIEVEGLLPHDKKQESGDQEMEDAREIVAGRPYHWKDWCMARGRDCLYIWSDAAALELSNGSNGWFRFILDGKLATMYSSGSPEGGCDSSESRGEFLEKLQRARSQVRAGACSQPILSIVGPTKLVVGNWALQCKKEGEVIVHNSDGQQATVLREDLAGFVFESNRGTKHTFTAETSLGPEFSTSWTGKRGKRLRSKVEQVKQKVKNLARELYDSHFKAAESHPRDIVAKLHSIVQQIDQACQIHTDQSKPSEGEHSWSELLKTALESLTLLLKDENNISAYELHSSGLVQALLFCLNNGYDHVASHDRHLRERISMFKAAFRDNSDDQSSDTPAVMLVRKLVAVLESIERLPMFLYDTPGSTYGLQVLTRRLRIRLEKASGENSLIDRTGRTLKMEPLTTVASLERYLLKMVAKQWYDYERSTFAFIKKMKEGSLLTFRHTHDFDENGIIYWVGTNAKTGFEWVNPAQYGLIVVNCSEGRTLPYGRLEDILSRDTSALNCHTNDDKKAWFSLDLGLWVVPSAYTLRHARGYGRSALRNWLFQVSKDNQNWLTLMTHTDDSSLNEPGSTATWPLEPSKDEKQGWRYIRLQQTGKNASGQTHYLSLSGFELYGAVTGVIEESLGSSKVVKDTEASLRKQRRLMRSQVLRQMVSSIGRGRGGMDWKWREQETQLLEGVMLAEHREAMLASSSKQSSSASYPRPGDKTPTDKGPTSGAAGGGGSGTCLVSRKSNSTPSLNETTPSGNKTTSKDRDHASTSDLTSSITMATTMVESALMSSMRSGLLGGTEDIAESPELVGEMETMSAATMECNTANKQSAPPIAGTPAPNTTNSTSSSSNSSMSVSVPNLSSTRDVVAGLMESFPALMRRSGSGSSGSGGSAGNTVLSGRVTNFTSSFVRFPLSSGLSSNFLSSAQSAPNLPATTSLANTTSSSQAATAAAATVASTLSSVLATSSMTTSSNNSSESDNEFLENCRASSLLAELEDEEFCPEPEELDDENEDDSEGDDYDDCTEEEDYDPRGSRRRTWDDEHVLKRQFSALVPAFDPRPGRTNVQQTTDLEIPPPGSPDTSFRDEGDSTPCPHLALFLRGPGLPGIPETEVFCDDPNSTVFKYIQMLYQHTAAGTKQEKLRRIWEPTYTVVYREIRSSDASMSLTENTEGRWSIPFVERHLGSDQLPKTELISYLQLNGDAHFLRRWKMSGAPKNIRKTRNCTQLIAAYKEFVHLGLAKPANQRSRHGSGNLLCDIDCAGPALNLFDPSASTVSDVLQLLRILYAVASDVSSMSLRGGDFHYYNVPLEEFYSKKITNKLVQQVQDPLVLASLSLPSWCGKLTKRCPMLFPFETRHLFFSCTAFGVSRAIAWLQEKRDASTERVRTPSTRRDDQHEFRVGRLKHERVKVPRNESQLLEWAINVMRLHSRRKSILEVEFMGEEGTGLGPTLEFYALVAAELQRKSLGMWLCDDEFPDDMSREVDIGEGVKPRGFYIQRTCGLFPAPLIQDSEDIDRVVKLYRFLGTFLAKCLQDTRIVDFPFSRPFLKLMCMGGESAGGAGILTPESSIRDSEVPIDTQSEASLDDIHDIISELSIEEYESKADLIMGDPPKPRTPSWFAGLLTLDDLELVAPHRAHFLKQLKVLVDRKRQILKDKSKTEEERYNEIQTLILEKESKLGPPVRLEDLGLTFQFSPSSSVYGYSTYDLKPAGGEEFLTLDNAEEYIELVTDFCLHTGIRRQIEAFREGFYEVFPIEKLHSFNPSELQTMICGDQAPMWTRDDILNYTDPKLGYTRESPGFQRFVNVMTSLNPDERKAFLQFTTGCSSLPPGGLANLHPRLTIVRKVDANDSTYPSVNTCVHYLKLPEYSSEEILRERLLSATHEKGFHLN